MTVKDLKELLDKVPEDIEVLVANYGTDCGYARIYSYDEPCVKTFSVYDRKLLITGYDDRSSYDYKKRFIMKDDVKDNAVPLI